MPHATLPQMIFFSANFFDFQQILNSAADGLIGNELNFFEPILHETKL
jgi:hypothetical protein